MSRRGRCGAAGPLGGAPMMLAAAPSPHRRRRCQGVKTLPRHTTTHPRRPQPPATVAPRVAALTSLHHLGRLGC